MIDQLRWGGAETLLADFAAAAASTDIRLTVSYLNSAETGPAADRLRDVGVEPVGLDVRGLVSPHGLLRVRRHVLTVQPDVIHTHLAYADVAGGLVGRSLAVPVVSTIHVMRWERHVRELARQAVISTVRRTCARRVITVSDSARAALLRARMDRPGHVVTVYNGVVGTPRHGSGRRVRQELGLRQDHVVVTMLTVLRPGKGHDIAVAAVAELRERYPGLRLVIAGDGSARAEIAASAARLGDVAVMAGHRNDVMELLDATDVLLHPTFVDALPTALIEAAAASVPVVASAVGGIPEIVDDGTTGLLVAAPPEVPAVVERLDSLLSEPARRTALGRAARARFEQRFSAEKWARRMRALYDEVVAEQRRDCIRAGSGRSVRRSMSRAD